MVRAELDDGQALPALNEVFVGHASHQSARYRPELRGTGGGTVLLPPDRGQRHRRHRLGLVDQPRTRVAVDVAPSDEAAMFLVREPRPSMATGAARTSGKLGPGGRAAGGVPHERGRVGVRGRHGRRRAGFRLGPHAPRFGERSAVAFRAGHGTPESASTIPCTGSSPRPARRTCSGHAEAGVQPAPRPGRLQRDLRWWLPPCSACPGWRTC